MATTGSDIGREFDYREPPRWSPGWIPQAFWCRRVKWVEPVKPRAADREWGRAGGRREVAERALDIVGRLVRWWAAPPQADQPLGFPWSGGEWPMGLVRSG